VLERLGREPARVEYSPPDRSVRVTVEIQRDVFAEKIRNRMYSRESASKIPMMIHRAAAGDFGPFLGEVIPKDRSRPDFIADGMYLAVTCAEDVPFIDQEEAARANAGNPFGNYRVFQQTRACGLWPRGKIPAGYHEPVDSKTATLILSGQVDPVTPPARGEEVASHLPNSRHIVVPHGAHGVGGLTNVECLDKVMLEFLAKGNANELDTGCVEGVRAPPFVTEKK
jgi:pimeloyl-ACP methyl ester carboxylesterase